MHEANSSSEVSKVANRINYNVPYQNRDVGRTTLVGNSNIVEKGNQPILQPLNFLDPEKETEAKSQVQKLLKKRLIEPIEGAWISPVVLVRKNNENWRFYKDFRQLNAVTQQAAYPLS